MKQESFNQFYTRVGAIALAAMLAGCAAESTVRVNPDRLVQQRHKESSKQEFIGFADDRAFVVVTLIPFAPWSIPETVVWWCPIHELSPEQFDTLKSRIKVPDAPNSKRTR